MRRRLEKLGLLHASHADSWLLYEHILFLVGDALRTMEPPCDLGWQTDFRSPKETPQRPAILRTVRSVVEQCIEAGWMTGQGKGVSPYNYELTPKGVTILASEVTEFQMCGEKLELFGEKSKSIVKRVIDRWVGKPPTAMTRELQEIAARAFVSHTPVPHYDYSQGLRPYFDGVAQRTLRSP
jgi:hypothetical protein